MRALYVKGVSQEAMSLGKVITSVERQEVNGPANRCNESTERTTVACDCDLIWSWLVECREEPSSGITRLVECYGVGR